MSILMQKGDNLDCRWQEDYVSPLRAMFTVSGKRILDIKHETWRQLYYSMMTTPREKVHDLGVQYENNWAIIFKCFWVSRCNKDLAVKLNELKTHNHIFFGGSLECND
jgi:hypothetical protein